MDSETPVSITRLGQRGRFGNSGKGSCQVACRCFPAQWIMRRCTLRWNKAHSNAGEINLAADIERYGVVSVGRLGGIIVAWMQAFPLLKVCQSFHTDVGLCRSRWAGIGKEKKGRDGTH